MAENTPPGPKTSGRVAGVVAIAAILVGGYYGLVAKPASTTATSSDAAPAAAGSKAPDAAPAADAAAKPAESAPADTAAKTPEPAADKAAEASAPAAADPKAAPAEAGQQAAVPAETTAPTFDIVRVEPTGETVVAGLAAPQAKVELLDGSAPIATAEANERGEWAMAVEKPLAPGTHDLSIRTTSADKKTETLSEQSVAVQVQEPGKGQALVVLNTPDAASKVLQNTASSGETKVAAATPEPAAPKVAEPAANAEATPPAPSSEGTAPAASSAPAQTEGAAKPDATPNSTATADASAKPDAAAPAAAATDTPANGDTLAESDKVAKPVDAASQPAPADAATADTPAAPAGETKSPDTKTAEAAAPAAEPKVTVDAVEVEDGKMFVAGSAKTNAPVRVYVDEKPVGVAKPGEGGRWLLEAPQTVEPGRRVVRADQLETDTGKVVARAEVPFERSADEAALVPVAVGSGAGGANADGNVPAPQNVIIRRGDNLWSISRRLYGRGIRFSTIYEANNDQIRNPDLIYPGQTFVLPTGDANWTN